MKRLALAVLMISVLAFSDLIVYTYDSMVSGLAKDIAPVFESIYGEKVKFLSFGDAGKALSRILIEGKKTKADVILGLDQTLLLKAKRYGILMSYRPVNYGLIKESLRPKDYTATPFDYGSIAIVYNTKTVKDPPRSFEDLLSPRFKRKIVVEDPRTSSTGLSFLLWTVAVYGDEFADYWRKLKDNILTVTSGWDEAFEMLERGEADLMVSYLTDGAYSYYYYKSAKFLPTVMKEGMFVQREYVGIVKYTKKPELAKRFVEIMLSSFVQKKIPLKQWMFPVTDVKLPEVFQKYVPRVNKMIEIDPEKVSKNLDKWINEWEEALGM